MSLFIIAAPLVLAVMWPALLLYHWIDQNQGITATARLLERAVPDKGMCLVLLAWSLSGLLEGIAGFGLPIALVAPMLVALGVPALRSVAAVAVGHSWAVTFGDMGVILQTLSAVVSMPVADLVPCAGILLGLAILICGLLAALVLGELRQWPKIAALSLVIGTVQYGLAAGGLLPLSAFGAGLSGLLAYLVVARLASRKRLSRGEIPSGSSSRKEADEGCGLPSFCSGNELEELRGWTGGPARLAIGCYGALTVLMAALTLVPRVQHSLQSVGWKPLFPGVSTSTGFTTPAGPGQAIRPLVHPGTLILFVACASIALACRSEGTISAARKAVSATVRTAGTASLGIILMVGLSTLMDHCGMSWLLAQGLSACLGGAYPLLAPGVGILGAFATGSNNNSNVLFGSLQKNVAVLQGIEPQVLVGAQTAGGSLGSMLAPAKIIVGCSTVGETGREGRVLRRTVPLGVGAGLALGVLALALSRLH
ncbi:MAG TPA: L-lactate permease [Verrucomicrobiae bacterium]